MSTGSYEYVFVIDGERYVQNANCELNAVHMLGERLAREWGETEYEVMTRLSLVASNDGATEV